MTTIKSNVCLCASCMYVRTYVEPSHPPLHMSLCSSAISRPYFHLTNSRDGDERSRGFLLPANRLRTLANLPEKYHLRARFESEERLNCASTDIYLPSKMPSIVTIGHVYVFDLQADSIRPSSNIQGSRSTLYSASGLQGFLALPFLSQGVTIRHVKMKERQE